MNSTDFDILMKMANATNNTAQRLTPYARGWEGLVGKTDYMHMAWHYVIVACFCSRGSS